MRLTGAAKNGATSHRRRVVVVSRAKHFNGRARRAQAATPLKGCSFGLRTTRNNRSSSSSPSSSSSSTRRVTRALVNVDFGPAMLLGSGMVASGLALYQVRVVRPEVSKDYDIMFASVALLCGGILIFQGWRLDPLLLFGQILTAGAAVTFAGEAIKLRGQVSEDLQAQIERERGGRNATNTMNGGLPGQEQTQNQGRQRQQQQQQQQQQDPYFQNSQDGYDDQRYYQDNSSYYAYSGGAASASSRGGSSYPSDMNMNQNAGSSPRRRTDLNSSSGNGNFVEFQTQNNEPGDEDDGFYRYEDDESESYNDQDDFNAYDVSSDWD